MSQALFGDYKTMTAGSAMSQYRRVRYSGTTLALAGATDRDCVGTLRNATLAANESVSVRVPGSPGTHKMVAHAAITALATVYAAASGRIDDTGTVAIGIALEAATAQDDVIEVLPLVSGNIQRDAQEYAVRLETVCTWDSLAVNIPAAAANDDMGLVTGTAGTDAPVLKGIDSGGTTGTSKCGFNIALPPEYVPGQTLTLRVNAAMQVISDGTATLDCNAYRADAPTVDICATAATSINSATAADVDFTLTPTNCVAGDIINVILTLAVTDSGNAADYINGIIYKISLMADVNF